MASKTKGLRRWVEDIRWLWISGSGMAIVLGWIFVPALWKPYVRVPATALVIRLNCVPSSVHVFVRSSYANTAGGGQIELREKPGETPTRIFSLEAIHSERLDHRLRVDLALSDVDQVWLAEATAKFKDPPLFTYSVLFGRLPHLDLQKLQVDASNAPAHACVDQKYKREALMKMLDGPKPTLMRYRVLQEDLGDLVLAFNNAVANLLLGGMLVALLWFSYLLVSSTRQLKMTTDTKLYEKFAQRYELADPSLRRQGRRAVVETEYRLTYRRLAFAKASGPALGFLLTVSSLSAALHPSVQSSQDTFRFVSGIQTAVIATFIGLSIRIVAHATQRSYRKLQERLLKLLEIGNPQ